MRDTRRGRRTDGDGCTEVKVSDQVRGGMKTSSAVICRVLDI